MSAFEQAAVLQPALRLEQVRARVVAEGWDGALDDAQLDQSLRSLVGWGLLDVTQDHAARYATPEEFVHRIDGDRGVRAWPTTATAVAKVLGDDLYEVAETFDLRLTTASGASLGSAARATGTIENDDPAPTISIADASKVEGAAGTTAKFTFTVSLSSPSGTATKVVWTTADQVAVAGSDYVAASGVLSIPAGAVSGTFMVTLKGDGVREASETFLINLSGPVNAAIADSQALGTIINDD